MGVRDKARHLATLYLEDISDLIIDAVDPHFGFSRYAERLGRSASSFQELNQALNAPLTYIDELLVKTLEAKIQQEKPDLVAITAPFPGNLYSALRCGQWIKNTIQKSKSPLVAGMQIPNYVPCKSHACLNSWTLSRWMMGKRL